MQIKYQINIKPLGNGEQFVDLCKLNLRLFSYVRFEIPLSNINPVTEKLKIVTYFFTYNF